MPRAIDEHRLNLLNSVSRDSLHTQGPASARNNYKSEEEAAKMEWLMDQAVARGQLEKSERDRLASGKIERTWWDKTLGFKESSKQGFGSVGQPVLDMLSLGNYAAAATTKASFEDPLFSFKAPGLSAPITAALRGWDTKSLKGAGEGWANSGYHNIRLGFSPKAWKKAFGERTTYADITGNFGGGLAMDVALDPTTYLTLGVGAGAKVAIRGGVKSAAKVSSKTTAKLSKKGVAISDSGVVSGNLTLTRYGSQIYRKAIARLQPIIDKSLDLENAERVARGVGPIADVSDEALLRLHDQVGDFMVANHGQLANDLAQQNARWGRRLTSPFDTAIEATTRHTGDDVFGWERKVASLFQETAPAHLAERGIRLGGMTDAVKRAAVVTPILGDAIRAFNRSYGVPKDVFEQHIKIKNLTRIDQNRVTRELVEGLGHLSKDEREAVTVLLELGEDGINSAGKIAPLIDHSDNVKNAVKFAKDRFKKIHDDEQAAGILYDSVEGYVSHMYKDRPIRELMIQSFKANGASMNHAGAAGFQMHRTISTLQDAVTEFGDDAVEMDIGAILVRRSHQSIQLLRKREFYSFIERTVGVPARLVAEAGDGQRKAASIIKGQIKAGNVAGRQMLEWDQLYSAEEALSSALGFAIDGSAGGRAKNMRLLRFLGKSTEERLADLAGDVDALVPNSFAQSSPVLKTTYTAGGRELDAAEFVSLAAESSMEDALLYLTGKGIEDLSMQDIRVALKGADKVFRDQLETPLLYMFPEMADNIDDLLKQSKKFGRKQKGGGRMLRQKKGVGAGIKALGDELMKPVDAKHGYKPLVDEGWIRRAKLIRMRYGDVGDAVASNASQHNDMLVMSKKFGFRADNLSDVIHALTGKRSMSATTSREADRVLDYLGFQLKSKGLDVRRSLFGERVMRVKLPGGRKIVFEDIAEGAAKQVDEFEQASMRHAQTIAARESLTAVIETTRQSVDDLTEQAARLANTSEGKLVKEALEIDKATLLRLEADIKTLKTPDMPQGLPDDARKFMSTTEFLARNSSNLVKDGLRLAKNLKGVERRGVKATRILGKNGFKSLRKIQTAISRKVKPLRDEVKSLEATLANGADVGDELELARTALNEGIAAARKEIVPTSKVRLLSGGRYVNAAGEVKDLMMRAKGSTGRLLNKDADEIYKAIQRDIIDNGRDVLDTYIARTVDKLPQQNLGPAAGEYILPESIAKLIEDTDKTLYAGNSEWVDGLLKGYDRLMNLWRAPILAPWGSTMFRNAVGNVTLGYLKAGLSLFAPKTLHPFMQVWNYALATESKTYKVMFGVTPDKLKALGEQLIVHRAGKLEGMSDLTVAEMYEEMGKRGVLTGMMTDEIFKDGDFFGRQFGKDVEAGVGAAVGGRAGRVAGAVAGAVAGPRGQGALMGGMVGGSVGGLPGAAVGAFVGGAGDKVAGGAIKGLTALSPKAGQALETIVGSMVGSQAYGMQNLFKFSELATEMPTRLLLGMSEYMDTGSLDEAGRAVRTFLHDYGELSVFERRVMRRVIPFYNFQKLAWRTTAKGIFEKPGRLLLPYKIFRDQNIASDVHPEDIPDWYHKQMVLMAQPLDPDTGEPKGWFSGALRRLGVMADGEFVSGAFGRTDGKLGVVGSLNLPLQEVLGLADDVVNNPLATLTRGPFGLVSVAEFTFNKDTFTGSSIRPDPENGILRTRYESGNKFKGAPDWLKSLVKFDEASNTVDPSIAWLIGEAPTGRFFNVSRQVFEASDEDVSSPNWNWNTLSRAALGVSVYAVDPETQQMYQDIAKIDKMKNVLRRIRYTKNYNLTVGNKDVLGEDAKAPSTRGRGGGRRRGTSGPPVPTGF